MKKTILKHLNHKINLLRGLGLLFAVLIGIISCSKSGPDVPDEPTPPAVPDKIELAATTDRNPVLAVEGGIIEISFNASTSWTASAINDRADSWCSASPASGSAGAGKITVSIKENTDPDERSASVIIKAGTASETIKVTQKQKDALIVTATKYEIPVDGGDFNVEIKANVSFKHTISEDAKDWINYVGTKALSTSTMIFSVKKNESVEGRNGIIIVGEGALCDTVKVYQAGETPAIVLSSKEYIAKSEGETFSVDVSSNVYVDINILFPDGSPAWLNENKTKAMSTNTYCFTASANEEYDNREAKIIFTNKEKNISDTVKVIQLQKNAIIISKNDFKLNYNATQISVEVKSNLNLATVIEYTDSEGQVIDIDDKWISESTTKALTAYSYDFDITENKGFEDRFARIIFRDIEIKLNDTVVIEQNNPYEIKLNKSNFNIGDAGGLINVSVSAGIEYDVIMPAVDWVTNLSNDKNSNTHHFKIDLNNSDLSRSTDIVFGSDKYQKWDTLKIVQTGGSYFFLLDDTLKLSYKETIFPVQSNLRGNTASFKTIIEPSYNWITEYNNTQTKGVHNFSFKASENLSDTMRVGKIVICERKSNIYDTVVVQQFPKSVAIPKNFSVQQKDYLIPMESQHIVIRIEHEDDYKFENLDKLNGNCLLFDDTPDYTIGNIDYHRIYINKADGPRQMHLYVLDPTRSICDTITIKQQETDEYIHAGYGFNASPRPVVPYSGITFSYDIHTNLNGYELLQFPHDGVPELTHLRREKKNFGYTDYFVTPVNTSDKQYEITLLYIGENTSFQTQVIIKPELKIIFDSSGKVLIPHSGGQFSTDVWTNDGALDVRIDGSDTEWLRMLKSEKESREDFTRIISTFEASPNVTGKQREAYIVAFNGFDETEKVRVVQPSGGNILLSESLNYLGAWEQVLKVELVDCNYNVVLESGNDWVNIGQSEKQDGKIIQNLEIAENATNVERSATVVFTSDTIVNKVSLIQLPESDALVDNSSELWRSFQLPKVNFKAPYPGSLGTMIYNAIVKDPGFLIEVESRKVLEQLYFSSDEPLIPRRNEIEYVLENYDGISAFYSSGRGSGIKLSYQYVESYYKQHGVKKLVEENRGVLSHELTHSFQLTPKGVGDYSNPIYHACIEGMADAVRVLTGHFTDADRPKGGSYLDSYRYTGFFIAWLVKTKDKDFLRKFNMSTQYLDVWSFDGAIKYALGEQYNVDDLWKEYQKAMGDIK